MFEVTAPQNQGSGQLGTYPHIIVDKWLEPQIAVHR